MHGIEEKLLEIIACPECKGKLAYAKKEQRLECKKCGLAYKIESGIPVLLKERAERI